MTRRNLLAMKRAPFTQWHRPGRAADVVVSVLACAVLSFLSVVALFAFTGQGIDSDTWRVIALVSAPPAVLAGLVRWAQIVAERAAERREQASCRTCWPLLPHLHGIALEPDPLCPLHGSEWDESTRELHREHMRRGL